MNKSSKEQIEGAGDMDDVGRLIQHAGAREDVAADRMENAHNNVAAHWESVVEDRQINKRAARHRYVAIAASIVAVVGLSIVFLQSTNAPPVPHLAQVERVLGDVVVAGLRATTHSEIGAGTVIETDSASRIAIRLAGGQSLRLDEDSRLVVHAPDRVTLDAGGVYIDTANAGGLLPVLVSTPLGTAWDVGTQFQVRLTNSLLIVGVRDGIVEVTPQGQASLSVNKGRYLELGQFGQKKERDIELDDSSWDWVETVVPEFVIEGTSLKDFLVWYANERGVSLLWDDRASETKAANAMLTGSVSGATLGEGLEIVRRIAPFEYRIDGEELWVKVN